MPPKRRRAVVQHHCGDAGCSSTACCTNPRVILLPFLADSSGQKRSVSTPPPSASLFNKPEFSDIKLKVGHDTFYAHRLILCAGSEVFTKMLSSNWSEGECSELQLQEDGDCAKVFERFLYYFYSGSITIKETYVIPLFMLADKYDVKPVYEECVKVIEAGLRVYVAEASDKSWVRKSRETPEVKREGGQSDRSSDTSSVCGSSQTDSNSSDSCDSSDFSPVHGAAAAESYHGNAGEASTSDAGLSQALLTDASASPHSTSAKRLRLIGSEVFPISLVLRMLKFWHNDRIRRVALYNLEARLGNQLSQDNYATWNGMSFDLVIQMLSDTHFCYGEYLLFLAAVSWLKALPERVADPKTVLSVMKHIRFPLLTTEELYQAEGNKVLRDCPQALALLQEAMKYRLFWTCCSPEDRLRWVGPQFEPRRPRSAKE